MIKFPCPHCRAENEIDPEYAGQVAECCSCSGDVIVPKTSPRARARASSGPQEVIARPGFSLHFKSLVKVLFIAGFFMIILQRCQIAKEERAAEAVRKANRAARAAQNP